MIRTQKHQYYVYACMSAVTGIYEENCKKSVYFIFNNIHLNQSNQQEDVLPDNTLATFLCLAFLLPLLP